MTQGYDIPQRITIDESVYEQFRVYTKLYGASEWGGVCVGFQEGDTFNVRGIVLPPQKIQSGAYCEFRKEVFPLVTKQIIRLTSDKKELFNFRSGAWIHTHPGFGVFFSGTDFNSFRDLTRLSPDFLGIVVDPINNAIKAFNGNLVSTTEAVTPEEPSEDAELEEVATKSTPKEEFTEVEVEIVQPDINDPVEMEFLHEFRSVMQSPASAREIGDTELINTFIPMEENEFKLSTMSMKVDYLEDLLSRMESRPVYSKDLAADWRRQLMIVRERFGLRDALIPTSFVIKPEGILYIWHETMSHLSADLVEWNTISSIEVKIRLEQDYSNYGYATVIKVIELVAKRKKSGFFGRRPKDLKLLVLVSDSRDLYRTVVEYFPRATMYRDLPVLEEPEEEEEDETEAEETDAVESDDEDKDEDLEDDVDEEVEDDEFEVPDDDEDAEDEAEYEEDEDNDIDMEIDE
ncbi:MAG: hypothetical protein ACFFE7_11905 [Candidatus Thorarchaeota archaeon]